MLKSETTQQGVKRVHEMEMGTVITSSGAVKFQLWAPTAKDIKLRLYETGSKEKFVDLPMESDGSGSYTLETKQASAGSDYHFVVDSNLCVPDPVSRYQPADIQGPSRVVDPASFNWTDQDWQGRPWEEAVVYELHLGTFSPEGTYAGALEKLDELVDLGITAIELLPLADFPGRRNWGYDGVLHFAPDSSYGSPDDLKKLVQAAHSKGLMVFVDVVYNHFGPEGNYLHAYAERFFNEKYHTPWGAAINYDGKDSDKVRRYVIQNVLYWLNEFHIDGLRFDAVNTIFDSSKTHILTEIAEAVRHGIGTKRHIHLALENDDNDASYLGRTEEGKPQQYNAQWNDDFHHAMHVQLTGEHTGYYADYSQGTSHRTPIHHIGVALAQGFVYQGEESHFRDGVKRGDVSTALPPTAFVNFLQNHDQIGNRAFGNRLSDIVKTAPLRAATAVWLLSPQIPLFYMGQEWAASSPFQFFCDFEPHLADAVRNGRRKEFAKFKEFTSAASKGEIPDPGDEKTFRRSKLDWQEATSGQHRQWWLFHQQLLAIRQKEIVPIISKVLNAKSSYKVLANDAKEESVLCVQWSVSSKETLLLLTNLANSPATGVKDLADALSKSQPIFSTHEVDAAIKAGTLPAWSTVVFKVP